MKDVLFVLGLKKNLISIYALGLKKNLISIYALDAKGMRVTFVDGQVLMCPKGKSIDDVVVIEEQE